MGLGGFARERWKDLRAALGGWFGRAKVSIMVDLVPPPYGGGNQFLIALAHALEEQGVAVGTNYVGPETRALLINSMHVDVPFLTALKFRYRDRDLRIVHRVDGPISVYRGTGDDAVDREIRSLNHRFADATIFQSQFSKDAHERLGLKFQHPAVIPNAPDPRIFYRPAERLQLGRRRLRLVATAWSDNPNKGADVLEWLDRHLDWKRFELMFIGRTSARLNNVKIVEPLASEELADRLRTQDVYLAPSRNDPCSNALLEALACGLPAIYRRSGGHPELVGEGGLGFEAPEEIPALLDRCVEEIDGFRAKIRMTQLAEVARRYRALLLPETGE